MKNKVNKNHPFFDRLELLMAEKEKKGLVIYRTRLPCRI